MKILFVFFVVLALSACSSKSTEVANVSEPQKNADRECQKVAVTGTRLGRKRCTTAAQREHEKQDSEEFVRSMRGH